MMLPAGLISPRNLYHPTAWLGVQIVSTNTKSRSCCYLSPESQYAKTYPKTKPKQRLLTEAHPLVSIVGVLKKRKMGVFASIVEAMLVHTQGVYQSTYPIKSLSWGPGISFINKSAMFVSPFSQATRINPAACAS
jgi:hypothetical protein